MGGSSSTQRTTIPDYVEDANRLAIQRANQIFELGRTPFTGIDVVGINPAERAAMENVASAASAFGMAVPQGDPFEGMETQTTGGLTGYSSYPLYIADMERLKEQRPDQYAAFARMSGFDPITGAALSPQASASPVGGAGLTPMQPRAGAGSESDVYVSERDKIAAALGQDPNKPRGMTFSGDYPTMQSMPQIRGYTLPDHGIVGNIADDFKTAVKSAGRQIKRDTNKLFGGLSNFLGGN